jgi:hypothetical protein
MIISENIIAGRKGGAQRCIVNRTVFDHHILAGIVKAKCGDIIRRLIFSEPNGGTLIKPEMGILTANYSIGGR